MFVLAIGVAIIVPGNLHASYEFVFVFLIRIATY